jgi:hypothetical protein
MKRKKVAHEYVLPLSINYDPKTMLPVKNHALLRKYYEKAFQSLKQANCRILAKAYIKLVEPRKQVNFPYNGRKVISGIPQQLDPETTKPPWWPTEVVHREPDHLLKAGRVHLLVHILCELRDSHAICVKKLREADQSIRRQFSPPECLEVLDEIYRVRGEEESYLDGKIGKHILFPSYYIGCLLFQTTKQLYASLGCILKTHRLSYIHVPTQATSSSRSTATKCAT